jgi:phospholipase/carboxylesterase
LFAWHAASPREAAYSTIHLPFARIAAGSNGSDVLRVPTSVSSAPSALTSIASCLMNRIDAICPRLVTRAHRKFARAVRPYTYTSECCFYFAPLHYEPNYSYPLIVWLHGPHNNELELKQIMPLVSMRNYVGAAPRATAASEQDCGAGIRFCWHADEQQLPLAEERLWECLDGARQRFNIAADRVFLAGLQCGGTMALRLGLRNPDQFAGAISFGGAFPTGGAPLARLHTARRLPLFLATTLDSELYPQEKVCEHLRLFHSASMSVTIQQYPGPDELTDLMLADMDRWIMERITQPRYQAADDLMEHRSAR